MPFAIEARHEVSLVRDTDGHVAIDHEGDATEHLLVLRLGTLGFQCLGDALFEERVVGHGSKGCHAGLDPVSFEFLLFK